MFEIRHITAENAGFLRDFSFSQEKGTTHVLLSQNVEFLDELQDVLKEKTARLQGDVLLEGRPLTITRATFITRTLQLYLDQSVIENVLYRQTFGRVAARRGRREFDKLLEETGFALNPTAKTNELSLNDQKIVEVLRCWYKKPEFLLIRELSGFVSPEVFAHTQRLIKRLNQQGTTVLYLTNRWEEAVQLPYNITVVLNGEKQGTYSPQEIVSDPRSIFYISMGAQKMPALEEIEGGEQAQKEINQGVHRFIRGYGLQGSMKMFSQYLLREMPAASVVIYLIDLSQNVIVDSMESTWQEEETVSCIRQEVLLKLLGEEQVKVYHRQEPEFGQLFAKKCAYESVLCNPFLLNRDTAIFLQLNFKEPYVHTRRDLMILKWVVQELGIFIENAQLMGNSVMLKESHHRIKNNLQIVVNLLEVEKACLKKTAKDQTVIHAFDSAIRRIKCIARVHDLLSKSNAVNTGEMQPIIQKVCELYSEDAEISISTENILTSYSKAVSVALIINELVCNSVKHNMDLDRPLKITLEGTKADSGQIRILCRDNGKGFDPAQEKTEKSQGVGEWILTSIVSFELKGTMRKWTDNGAVVEILLPEDSLLPVEKREAVY